MNTCGFHFSQLNIDRRNGDFVYAQAIDDAPRLLWGSGDLTTTVTTNGTNMQISLSRGPPRSVHLTSICLQVYRTFRHRKQKYRAMKIRTIHPSSTDTISPKMHKMEMQTLAADNSTMPCEGCVFHFLPFGASAMIFHLLTFCPSA